MRKEEEQLISKIQTSPTNREELIKILDETLATWEQRRARSARAANRPKPRGRANPADPRLPAPGTLLATKSKGKVYAAEMMEGGFVKYEGRVYNSVSDAASAINGYPTNGYLFWGLRKPLPRRRAS